MIPRCFRSFVTSASSVVDYTAVNDFWFGDPVVESGRDMWWKKDATLDAEIKDKFLFSLEAAKSGRLEEWSKQPMSCLALVVLLDQFSRNIFRDQPQAFEADNLAKSLVIDAIELNMDTKLHPIQRSVFYLPFEHSENKEDQKRSVELYAQLLDAAPKDQQTTYEQALQFAKKHKEIIDRFGRFPHRNQILQRPSSEEEIQFLTQPGSSF